MDNHQKEETTEETKKTDYPTEDVKKEKPYWTDYQEYLVNLS